MCPECNTPQDIVKPADHSSFDEFCTVCFAKLQRIYTVPLISCKVHDYSPAHGIDLANKSAVRDMKRKYNDDTGSNMIEVGNENTRFTPKKQSYDLPREVMNQIHAS